MCLHVNKDRFCSYTQNLTHTVIVSTEKHKTLMNNSKYILKIKSAVFIGAERERDEVVSLSNYPTLERESRQPT